MPLEVTLHWSCPRRRQSRGGLFLSNYSPYFRECIGRRPRVIERQLVEELERIRSEWVRARASLDLSKRFEHVRDDTSQYRKAQSLDSYVIGETWLHIHLIDFSLVGT